ncbi:MAG: hypothetical protein QOE23_2244, partial [Pseudonocardiales bacterium]|nr:hypothetical protein [Pseudonocardiales bacterium]
MHEAFEFLLNRLAPSSQVGSDVLGEVLARVSEKAPHEVSRKEIALAKSRPNRPPAREIPQGTVSKAVKALLHEGLIEDGDTVLWSQEGRVLAPLRLGRRYVIAGVEITLHDGQPVTITTVLTGLDGTLLLAKVARLDPDETRWHALAGLVYDEVASLQRDYERQCRRQNRRSPG